ncbi:MAG: DUF488 domain-containing protein [Burkholderiaceae bacterium]|nr:DUF488 domain-containing protein [Burkholderiaceae bacterium]
MPREPTIERDARLWTVGHSSRAIDGFVGLLRAHAIECVADVRRHAGSRKHPQFNPDALARSLREAGIDYEAMPALGGRRPARGDSPHTVWRNPSFRGYADYMDSTDFARALEALEELAGAKRTAIMCSEAVWWRCHRSMIADALKAKGWRVLHILAEGPAKEHPYTPAASVADGHLVYGQADDAAR